VLRPLWQAGSFCSIEQCYPVCQLVVRSVGLVTVAYKDDCTHITEEKTLQSDMITLITVAHTV